MVAMQHIHVGYVHQCKTATQIPSVLLVLTRQSWLHLQVRSAALIHALLFFVCLFVCFFLFFFTRAKKQTNTHLPHYMQQSMGYTYIQSPEASSYWPFKWPTLAALQ